MNFSFMCVILERRLVWTDCLDLILGPTASQWYNSEEWLFPNPEIINCVSQSYGHFDN